MTEKLIEEMKKANAWVIGCAHDVVRNGGTRRLKRHDKAVDNFIRIRSELQAAGVQDESMKIDEWFLKKNY